MLSYEKFKEELVGYMEQEIGGSCRVGIRSIRKANAGVRDAMAVFGKGNTRDSISPSIYLEPLYHEYKEGAGMQEIAETAAAMYYRGMESAQDTMESMPNISSYESCRGRLYFRLVGTERNRHLLGEVPHREVLDLSLIPYLLVKGTGEGASSIMVSNNMAGCWGIPAEDVMEQACANAPKILPAVVSTMQSVLKQVLGESADRSDGRQETIGNIGEPEGLSSILSGTGGIPGIFIMTNKKGLNGFAAVLYPGALKDAADMIGKDLYVMPSSVHEAVLVPAGSFAGASRLAGIVREVNASCVAEEEIVSDSVYFYDRKERKLCMAGEERLCVRL